MPAHEHKISHADLLDFEVYAAERDARRKAMTEFKKNRRLAVGPHATFYFENYETMVQQIHEMLFIEGGGEAQIPGELEAYNPLIPQGGELVATMMIEIENETLRRKFLAQAGGIEESLSLRVAGETTPGEAERDIDRTTADGKASAVHFVHFRMIPEQVAAFKRPDTEVVLAINHPHYNHRAGMPEPVRAALAGDLD